MLDIISSLIIVLAVIALAYYTTYFIAKHSQLVKHSKYIECVDRLYIDKETVVSIIKIEDHYQVLVTNGKVIENLGVIDSLSEIPEVTKHNDFSDILKRATGKLVKRNESEGERHD